MTVGWFQLPKIIGVDCIQRVVIVINAKTILCDCKSKVRKEKTNLLNAAGLDQIPVDIKLCSNCIGERMIKIQHLILTKKQ